MPAPPPRSRAAENSPAIARADGLSGTSTAPAASNRRFGWEMRRMAYAGNDDAGARRGPIASLAPAEAT
jgi:hypothetical protein